MSLNLNLSDVKPNVIKENSELELPVTSSELELPITKTGSDQLELPQKSFSLALNLEAVSQIEEEKEIVSEFQVDEFDIERIVAAIGAGFATESVINARYLDENLLVEGRGLIKTVVRKGKLVKKNICPEGFKTTKSGMCERMSSKDIIAFKKRAMKAAKTRARKKPTAASMKMRARSMLVRGNNAGRVNRVAPAAAHTQVN